MDSTNKRDDANDELDGEAEGRTRPALPDDLSGDDEGISEESRREEDDHEEAIPDPVVVQDTDR
jgi:hypothetical protein